MWCDVMGLWKKWMVYPNTCVSSSLCKVRFLTECQWPYIGASLACQWSGVGCWRDGTRMWCELLWRLPPPMLCDHWCCLVCWDIASWSLGTGSPPTKPGSDQIFRLFYGELRIHERSYYVRWSWFLDSILRLSLSTNQTLCGKFRKSQLSGKETNNNT